MGVVQIYGAGPAGISRDQPAGDDRFVGRQGGDVEDSNHGRSVIQHDQQLDRVVGHEPEVGAQIEIQELAVVHDGGASFELRQDAETVEFAQVDARFSGTQMNPNVAVEFEFASSRLVSASVKFAPNRGDQSFAV